MFEKETRFIHDICMNQINRLGSFVTFEELTGTELHPAILKYISAEIDLMILEDRQKLLEYSNFDYTGEEMTDAFRQVGQIIKSSKKFPIDYISNIILLAISFNINFLIRPRHTLVNFIYQKEDVLNASFVKHMLNYTYYYSYIRKVFEKFSVKKALLTVPKSDFETILMKLDQEMFDSHTNRIMDTALNSIADFFNIGSVGKSKIPLSALEPFLMEKNLENYLDRLHSAFPAATKFSYNIPDVQRIMYSTTPIKRESYLNKASQKKVQDSVLGIEAPVVNPKEEVKEESSKSEFQEAEFVLIPENDEPDTISRLRSKSTKEEKREEKSEERREEKKVEVNEPVREQIREKEPAETEEVKHEYNRSDFNVETRTAPVEDEPEKIIKEEKPAETKPKNRPVVEKEKFDDVTQLENEAMDLLNLYDKEMGGRINLQETYQDNPGFQQDDDEDIDDENNTADTNDPVQVQNAEPEIEEEVDETDSDDDFIVVGEEGSGIEDKKEINIPAAGIRTGYGDTLDEKKSSETKNDSKIPNEQPAGYKNPNYDIIKKRRILVKKFKPVDKKRSQETPGNDDDSLDESDQGKMINEITYPLPVNEHIEDAEPVENIKDIFACFTEKELQKILKYVFNDDAEDFALTLDTIAACGNYDEAAKLLRSLFRSYKVKIKSKEAVILRKAISEFYSRSNNLDEF